MTEKQTGKKVTIGARPTTRTPALSPDKWVESRTEGDDPMKRLTIDIPESLHRRIKGACAMRGTKIADEVRELLIQKYGKE